MSLEQGREDRKDNDLFFTCGLIDYIARKTKNTRSTVVEKLGKKRLSKIYDLADIYHCDNIDKVSDDIVVFHAGTALKDGKLVTNGGRVLNVCAKGANLQEALAKVYETATIITFDGMYYRHDIGLR